MPRDSNGNYTLPSGNPVVSNTTIESAWANTTMDDLRQAMTDSLDRFGRGGMQAPFRFVDGTVSAPGMSWASEISTGFYRAGGNDMRATVAGINRMRWTSTGVDVWDTANSQWLALVSASGSNFALLNASNQFTQPQAVRGAGTAWQVTKPGTPDLGARFGFNISQADGLDLSRFNGTDWQPKMVANATLTQFLNDQFDFYSAAGTTLLGRMTLASVFFGDDGYAPVTSGATSLGYSKSGTVPVAIGCFHRDGAASPRTELFAFGDGVSSGIVGVDWVFNTGVAAFEFRRANVPVARYTVDTLEAVAGNRLGVRSPNNATASWWQQDNLGASYWNTDVSVSQFQWYLNSQLLGSLSPAGLSLTTYNGAAVGNDIAVNRLGGVGGNQVGQNAWVQLFNTGQGHGWGFQLGAPGDGAACRFYGFNGGSWQERFRMDFNFMSFFWGGGVRLLNPDNTLAYIVRLPSGGNSVSPCWDGAGALLWHHDATFRYGGIFVSTSAAPPSGGTPGQIWLQTAT